MTDRIKDGGNAFPTEPRGPAHGRNYDGMTLRDWFAGQASESDIKAHTKRVKKNASPYAELENDCTREQAKYRYADAMLEASLIAAAPDLAAEVIRLREALEPFAEAADGRKSKNISGSHCFGQAHLLKARAALNHKEME